RATGPGVCARGTARGGGGPRARVPRARAGDRRDGRPYGAARAATRRRGGTGPSPGGRAAALRGEPARRTGVRLPLRGRPHAPGESADGLRFGRGARGGRG